MVHLSDGSTIKATADHRFYEVKTRSWVKAQALKVGAAVVTAAGALLMVTGTTAYAQDVTAYNLTVEGAHTYYAGDTGVLVHNCGDPFFREDVDILSSDHIYSKHMPGAAQSALRENAELTSEWSSDIGVEGLLQLVDESASFKAVVQSNGRCARECDAGRIIGTDASLGGIPTSIYTVISNPNGSIVTVHPGRWIPPLS